MLFHVSPDFFRRLDVMYKRVETEVSSIYALSWASLLMNWVLGHCEWRLILVRSWAGFGFCSCYCQLECSTNFTTSLTVYWVWQLAVLESISQYSSISSYWSSLNTWTSKVVSIHRVTSPSVADCCLFLSTSPFKGFGRMGWRLGPRHSLFYGSGSKVFFSD